MLLRPDLAETIRRLPLKPGVYLFRDAQGDVLYVGKAVKLRQRVRSYFQSSRSLTEKTLHMINQIEDIEVIVTDNEVEALILESNLIKRYQPPYNIRLRDDKHYPYLKVTTNEPWPRVLIVRSIENDGARYFGPYADAGAVHETLRAIRSAFPYRTCSNYRVQQPGRPCLEYYIGRCLAPCDGRTSQAEYGQMIEELCRFLEGRDDTIIRRLTEQMEAAAEELDFERAAELRDRRRALTRVLEKQKMISSRLEDQDVIAYAKAGDQVAVQVFFVREGRVVGREHYILTDAADSAGPAIMAAFIKQHYAQTPFIPRELLLNEWPEEEELAAIEQYLSDRRGSKVFVRVPQRGEKKRLVAMVEENARLLLEQAELQQAHAEEERNEALTMLAEALQLDTLPVRMECFDISNLHGEQAVGSMVVFENGRPKKSDYRRFRIRTVTGSNDYAMMQEVLHRRFERALADDEKFRDLPDLIVVDGGKGQLNAALEVLKALNLDHIPLVALAERFEHLYRPGRSEPIELPHHSPALRMVTWLRDEAHRFAVSYHRRLRTKRSIKSLLDDIPGIGPKRRAALLKAFGSIEAIQRASIEELSRVPGMNRQAAAALKERL